ncbi:MAG: hypothetical protein ABL872_14100 [Lacibacter sp.]
MKKNLQDLSDSAANETKSTAGDKHETALAMLQIEQENSSRQLNDVLKQKAVLEKIDPSLQPEQVVSGSLVKTNKGYFFISLGLGKITVDEQLIIALSPESLLGIQMMHLKKNDLFSFNGMQYRIENIE